MGAVGYRKRRSKLPVGGGPVFEPGTSLGASRTIGLRSHVVPELGTGGLRRHNRLCQRTSNRPGAGRSGQRRATNPAFGRKAERRRSGTGCRPAEGRRRSGLRASGRRSRQRGRGAGIGRQPGDGPAGAVVRGPGGGGLAPPNGGAPASLDGDRVGRGQPDRAGGRLEPVLGPSTRARGRHSEHEGRTAGRLGPRTGE